VLVWLDALEIAEKESGKKMEAKAKGKRSQAADGQRQRQADDKEAFFGWQHPVAE